MNNKRLQQTVAQLARLSQSPEFWRLVFLTIASVGGSILAITRLRQYWLHAYWNKAQQIQAQNLPTDIEQLKAFCLEKIQENQALIDEVNNRDKELTTQRQSLANLALTVVKQDRHIKALLGHMDVTPMQLLQETHNQLNNDLKSATSFRNRGKTNINNSNKGSNNLTRAFLPDRVSVSGLSGGLAESSDGEDNFENYQNLSINDYDLSMGIDNEQSNLRVHVEEDIIIDDEEDEVSQLKLQIMEASDILNDMVVGDEVMASRSTSNGTNLSSSFSAPSRSRGTRNFQQFRSTRYPEGSKLQGQELVYQSSIKSRYQLEG